MALGIVAAAVLATPSVAAGKTFCVQDPACPADGDPKATLQEAANAAASVAGRDRIQIGPVTLDVGLGVQFGSGNPVQIVGAGAQRTILTGSSAAPVLGLDGPTSSVLDLGIRPGVIGLSLSRSVASRVAVSQDASSTVNALGVDITKGGRLSESFVRTAVGVRVTGFENFLGFKRRSTVSNSTIIATGTGVVLGNDAAIRGARIFADDGVEYSPDTSDAKADLSDVLIASVGTGVSVTNPDTRTGELAIDRTTIVGKAANSTGIHADNFSEAPSPSNADTTVTLRSSVLARNGTDIHLQEDGSIGPVKVAVAYSSFAPGKVSNASGGEVTEEPSTNLHGLAPLFVNPAASDFRLAHNSPLIERGAPGAPAAGAEDAAAKPRFRDGDGNGGARIDMGAYEYQRVPPTPAFTTFPSPAMFGALVRFTPTATDPDGDPVSYAWKFGDGSGASAAKPTHRYFSGGTKQVALTLTDATGLKATATNPLLVKLHPGECANVHNGTAGNDTLSGTKAGDKLVGKGGADKLRGKRGPDCLLGGNGADTLNGGKGTNDYRAGRGDDTVKARNQKKETIRCGDGKDVATVDANDVVKGCETVERP